MVYIRNNLNDIEDKRHKAHTNSGSIATHLQLVRRPFYRRLTSNKMRENNYVGKTRMMRRGRSSDDLESDSNFTPLPPQKEITRIHTHRNATPKFNSSISLRFTQGVHSGAHEGANVGRCCSERPTQWSGNQFRFHGPFIRLTRWTPFTSPCSKSNKRFRRST